MILVLQHPMTRSVNLREREIGRGMVRRNANLHQKSHKQDSSASSPPKHEKERSSKGKKAKKRKSEAQEPKAISAVESSSVERPSDRVDISDSEEEKRAVHNRS